MVPKDALRAKTDKYKALRFKVEVEFGVGLGGLDWVNVGHVDCQNLLDDFTLIESSNSFMSSSNTHLLS